MNRRDLTSGAIGATVTGAVLLVLHALAQGASHPNAAGDSRGKARDSEPAGSARANACELEMAANRNLVYAAYEYKERFERASQEKEELASRQSGAESSSEPAAEESAPERSEWDLTADQARELAKMGSVKLRFPCGDRKGWKPDAATLQTLGLAPQDARVLEQAAMNAYRESWKEIKPMCAALEQGDADALGRDRCIDLIQRMFSGDDTAATDRAMRRAAEVRAGLRPAPAINDTRLHTVERLAQVLAVAQQSYEREIAQALGPEEAHRVAWSESVCASYAAWEGAGEPVD